MSLPSKWSCKECGRVHGTNFSGWKNKLLQTIRTGMSNIDINPSKEEKAIAGLLAPPTLIRLGPNDVYLETPKQLFVPGQNMLHRPQPPKQRRKPSWKIDRDGNY